MNPGAKTQACALIWDGAGAGRPPDNDLSTSSIKLPKIPFAAGFVNTRIQEFAVRPIGCPKIGVFDTATNTTDGP
jgi:hypothetical protein